MARLIYTAITSLDGYVADADGHFGWSAPDEEVHPFVNEFHGPTPFPQRCRPPALRVET